MEVYYVLKFSSVGIWHSNLLNCEEFGVTTVQGSYTEVCVGQPETYRSFYDWYLIYCIRDGRERLIITYEPLICSHLWLPSEWYTSDMFSVIHRGQLPCWILFPTVLTFSEVLAVPPWIGPSWSPLKSWFCNCSSGQGWKPGSKTYWPSGLRNLLTSLSWICSL